MDEIHNLENSCAIDWVLPHISNEPSADRHEKTVASRPERLSMKDFWDNNKREKLDKNCNISCDSVFEKCDVDEEISAYAEQVIRDASKKLLDDSFGDPEFSSTRSEDQFVEDGIRIPDKECDRSPLNASFASNQDLANSSNLSTLTVEEGNEVELFCVKPLSDAEVKKKLLQTFDHGGRYSRCSNFSDAVASSAGELDLESLSSHPQLEQLENVEVSIKCEISTVLTKFGISTLTDLVTKSNEQLMKENVVQLGEVMKDMERSYKKEVEALCQKHQEEMDMLRNQMKRNFEVSYTRSDLDINANASNNNNNGDNASVSWSRTDLAEEQWQEVALLRESYDKELTCLLQQLEVAKLQSSEKQVEIEELKVEEQKLRANLNSSVEEIGLLRALPLVPKVVVTPTTFLPPDLHCACCSRKDETIESQLRTIEELRGMLESRAGPSKVDPSDETTQVERLARLLDEKMSEIVCLRNTIDELNSKLSFSINGDRVAAYERYLSDIEEGGTEDGEGLDEKFLCSSGELKESDGDDDDDDDDSEDDSDDDDDDEKSDSVDDDESCKKDVEDVPDDDLKQKDGVIVEQLISFDDDNDGQIKDKDGGNDGKGCDNDEKEDDDDDDESGEEPCLRSARWDQLLQDRKESTLHLDNELINLSSDFNGKDDDYDDDDDDDDDVGDDSLESRHADLKTEVDLVTASSFTKDAFDFHLTRKESKSFSNHFDEIIELEDSCSDPEDSVDVESDKIACDVGDDLAEAVQRTGADDGGDDSYPTKVKDGNEPPDKFLLDDVKIDLEEPGKSVEDEIGDDKFFDVAEVGDDISDVGREPTKVIRMTDEDKMTKAVCKFGNADDDDDDEPLEDLYFEGDDDDGGDMECVEEKVNAAQESSFVNSLHRAVDKCISEGDFDFCHLDYSFIKKRIALLLTELKNNSSNEKDLDRGEEGIAGRGVSVGGGKAGGACDSRESTLKEMELEIAGLKESVGREEQLRAALQLELKGVRASLEERLEEEMKMRMDALKVENVVNEGDRVVSDTDVDANYTKDVCEAVDKEEDVYESDGEDDLNEESDDDDDDDDDEVVGTTKTSKAKRKFKNQMEEKDGHLEKRTEGAKESKTMDEVRERAEVVEILADDLERLKSDIQSLESQNQQFSAVIAESSRATHEMEKAVVKFFTQFELFAANDSNANVNNAGEVSPLDCIHTQIDEFVRQSLGGSHAENRRSLNNLLPDESGDTSCDSLLSLDSEEAIGALTGSTSRLQTFMGHMLKCLQTFHDKMTRMNEQMCELSKQKADLYLEKNRLDELFGQECKRRHDLDLELHGAKSTIGSHVKEKQQVDEQLRQLEERRVELVLSLEKAEAELLAQRSVQEDLKMREEHVERQRSALLHSGIEEAVRELMNENKKLSEECQTLNQRLSKERTLHADQLNELESSNEQVSQEMERLKKESAAAVADAKMKQDALEKQLKSDRKFFEDQVNEREQEIEDFQARVEELEVAKKDWEKSSSAQQKLKLEIQELEEQVRAKSEDCIDLMKVKDELDGKLKEQNVVIAGLHENIRILESEVAAWYKKEVALIKKQEEDERLNVEEKEATSKEKDEDANMAEELEVLRRNWSDSEEVLAQVKKSELSLMGKNSQLEKLVEELKLEKEMLEKQEMEFLNQISALKMKLEERCFERMTSGDSIELSERLREERIALEERDRKIEVVSIMLEEMTQTYNNQTRSLEQASSDLQAAKKENVDLNVLVQSLTSQNADCKDKISKLSKELEAAGDAQFDLEGLGLDLLNQKNEEIEELVAENAELKQQLDTMASDSSVRALSANISRGTPELARKSAGSSRTNSIAGLSAEEEFVNGMSREAFHRPEGRTDDLLSDGDVNDVGSFDDTGVARRGKLSSAKKVAFADERWTSEEVFEELLKHNVDSIADLSRLFEQKCADVEGLEGQLREEQEEKDSIRDSLILLEKKLEESCTLSDKLKAELQSKEKDMEVLTESLEDVRMRWKMDVESMSQTVQEHEKIVSELRDDCTRKCQEAEKLRSELNELKSIEADAREIEKLSVDLEKQNGVLSRVLSEKKSLEEESAERAVRIESLREEKDAERRVTKEREEKYIEVLRKLEMLEEDRKIDKERMELLHRIEIDELVKKHMEEIGREVHARPELSRFEGGDIMFVEQLGHLESILPDDQLSDDLQSILKKLHQEAMRVLTLSDFQYLEDLERRAAELDRSKLEWNVERQEIVRSAEERANALTVGMKDLQESLDIEKLKNEDMMESIKEGESKLRKFKTEKVKMEKKLLAEKEVASEVAKKLKSEKDLLENELLIRGRELEKTNSQRDMLRCQLEEIKMKLSSIEEQLKSANNRDNQTTAATSSSAKLFILRQMEFVKNKLQLVASMIRSRSFETLLELLESTQKDFSQIMADYDMSPSPGYPDAREIDLLKDKMLQHNTYLTQQIQQISKDKEDLKDTLEGFTKQYDDQEIQKRLLLDMMEKRFSEERMRVAHGRQVLQDQLDDLKGELVKKEAELRSVNEQQSNACQESSDADKKKIQRLYAKYVKAESFRKSLVYQKKYLLMVLEEFQESERATLSAIGRMTVDAQSRNVLLKSDDSGSDDGSVWSGIRRDFGRNLGRFGCGGVRSDLRKHNNLSLLARFRSAARVVVAISRLKFLVRKWNKTAPVASISSTSARVLSTRPSSSVNVALPGNDQNPKRLFDNHLYPLHQMPHTLANAREVKSANNLDHFYSHSLNGERANPSVDQNQFVPRQRQPDPLSAAAPGSDLWATPVNPDKKNVGFTPPTKDKRLLFSPDCRSNEVSPWPRFQMNGDRCVTFGKLETSSEDSMKRLEKMQRRRRI